MPSILDIAPPELTAEEVDIRGPKLRVQGIGADGWVRLYTRFPELRAMLTGNMDGVSELAAFSAQVALIAAGLGKPDDAETEQAIMRRLSREDIQLLGQAINRLSQPGHVFGPLLNGAALDGDAAPDTAVPATK